eukprot:9029168-Pyramimonas_sp.AAC.1
MEAAMKRHRGDYGVTGGSFGRKGNSGKTARVRRWPVTARVGTLKHGARECKTADAYAGEFAQR